MREIKFRGKITDIDDWVCGDIIRHYKNQRRFIACNQMAYEFTTCGINRLVSENYYEVKPETVGQYTGLKDKNGVEIYEGDIVEIETFDLESEKFQIVWFENVALGRFCGVDINGESWNITNDNGIEIIGNIHENPELLEVVR